MLLPPGVVESGPWQDDSPVFPLKSTCFLINEPGTCGSVFRQFPRGLCCALPASSRSLTATPFRGDVALKDHDHIGHGLMSIVSGDVEGAGLGAQSIAPAEFRGVS